MFATEKAHDCHHLYSFPCCFCCAFQATRRSCVYRRSSDRSRSRWGSISKIGRQTGCSCLLLSPPVLSLPPSIKCQSESIRRRLSGSGKLPEWHKHELAWAKIIHGIASIEVHSETNTVYIQHIGSIWDQILPRRCQMDSMCVELTLKNITVYTEVLLHSWADDGYWQVEMLCCAGNTCVFRSIFQMTDLHSVYSKMHRVTVGHSILAIFSNYMQNIFVHCSVFLFCFARNYCSFTVT